MSIHINDVNSLDDKVLSVIVQRFGAYLFDMNSLLRLDIKEVYAKSDLKLALLRLCKNSKVNCLRKIAGEQVYCVPYKVYFEQMTRISMDILPYLEPKDDFVDHSESTKSDIIMDLIILFGWVGREQPKMNKKGQIDKKLIESMLTHIHLTPEALTGLVGKGTTKVSYPIVIGILLDLGLRLGAIQLADGQFILNDLRVTQWLGIVSSKERLDLFHLWFSVHYPEQHIVRQLFVLLPLLPYAHWFKVDHLFKEIELKLKKIEMEESNEVTKLDLDLDMLLQAVQELGWVKLEQDKDGNRVICSLIGTQQSRFDENQIVYWFVQPDYEIIAPLQVNYSDHYQFNIYAKLQSRNLMCSYSITKESMFAAFDQGWTPDKVMKHLGSCARYGIPETIQTRIREWDQQYRGVQLESVTILRCDTVVIAEQLMSFPDVDSILNEHSRIGPMTFLIPEEHVSFTHKKMNEYGYRTNAAHRRSIASHSTTSTSNDEVGGLGIYHSKIRYDMYTEVEPNLTIESLYPGFAEIPSGWMNMYVSYHISTRIQLLQQAIDWQCYVMTLYAGEDILLAPNQITSVDSIPHVEGLFRGEKLYIGLDQLELIRLIVPGFHDATKYMSTTD